MSDDATSPDATVSPLTVIVTGASSGIGAAIARDLHGRGHRVVLAARREAQLRALARELSPAGHRVLTVPTDVTSEEDRARLLSRAREVFGPIDVLINNAGMGGTRGTPLWERETLPDTLEVNLTALVDLTRRALPEMVARGRGHIINIASVAGHVGGEALYSASKFGVRGFSLGLRRQLLGSGVSVSLVSPGFVQSEMTSDLRFSLPKADVVARAVASLIARPRREVVVPGFYRVLIALDHLFPRLGDAAVRLITRNRR